VRAVVSHHYWVRLLMQSNAICLATSPTSFQNEAEESVRNHQSHSAADAGSPKPESLCALTMRSQSLLLVLWDFRRGDFP